MYLLAHLYVCFDCFSDIELYELYILEIIPSSIASFAVIFSHSKGYLFIRSYLFIFIFISVTLGGGSKSILLQSRECTAYAFL